MTEKRLVVTGGTGKKTGGAFVRELAAHRDEIRKSFPGGIRASVRTGSDTKELEKLLPDAEILRGEATDAEYLKRVFTGADTAVHIAGIHISRLIVAAAAECGVRRLILVHTTGIYSRYKEAGEEYRKIDADVTALCAEKGILLTILRPTMIYGNTTDCNVVTFIRMVDRLPLMPVVNGARYELQPVHYADLGRALYAVLMNEEKTAGRNYDLSGGKPILLRDMLTAIGKELGKKVRFVSCPFPVAYFGAKCLYTLSGKRCDYREKVQRLCEPRAYPHDAAAEDFGYAPMDFEEGVKEEVAEYLRAAGR